MSLAISDEIRSLPIECIGRSISTPRETHDPAALERLAHWIRRRGLLQPILVRAIDANEYEVVAGERRLLAARRAGLERIDCRVRVYPDSSADDEPLGDVMALEDALVENLVREGLGKLEESEAILDLVCLHLGETRAFVLERLGAMHGRAVKRKTPINVTLEDDSILEVFAVLNLIGWRAFYTHRAPLLRLPEGVKRLLFERRVSYAAATRIARLEEEQQVQMIARVQSSALRGTALKLELNGLLNTPKTTASSRIARLGRALPQHLEKPGVERKLAALERELGLP
jgi:ParB family transcriptional regulator, chromosome partitioning protein